ncbi:DUF202 domain-containing protein [Isoptericola sp. NPDC019482]|uniref:YidH family protein n=1 Tax=Isoptericola sp. NPDC019482 TaxID=3154688 RepID=UPI0034767701
MTQAPARETVGTRPPSPRWVYAEGADPDPRFSLANERTFLAWIRTTLALVAGGVALEGLDLAFHPGLRAAAALLLLAMGVCLPFVAYAQWGRVERALRRAEPLPANHTGLVVAAGTVLVTALLAASLLPW